MFAFAAMGASGASMAQEVGRDFVAAPDVYKVRSENDQLRMVDGTWQPGQRDAFHSHPAMGYYWVTGCALRFHLPNGVTRDDTVAIGQAGVQAPIASHSVENLGKTECRIVMFESK
jgi:quercetin dioxygenase-like cupin family protein